MTALIAPLTKLEARRITKATLDHYEGNLSAEEIAYAKRLAQNVYDACDRVTETGLGVYEPIDRSVEIALDLFDDFMERAYS